MKPSFFINELKEKNNNMLFLPSIKLNPNHPKLFQHHSNMNNNQINTEIKTIFI